MPQQRSGSIIKRSDRPGLWARVSYVDDKGKTRVIQRKVESRTEGRILLKKLLREIEDYGASIIDGEKLTFGELAEIYRDKKLIPPVYQGDSKIAGLRSWKSQHRRLKTLVEYFGKKKLRSITHGDLVDFKLKRLAKKTERRKGERTPADVNRDLQLMRAMLNYALREGWILRNPFHQGDSVISISQEKKRERVLSRQEEERLLTACEKPTRRHLKPILICARDTGMRRGEIFQLCWKDVDLDAGEINLRATTTKTLKARTVPITSRLRLELERLKASAPPEEETLVFGVKDNVKRSFAAACADAQVENFDFRDTRHTALTRWIEQGMPPMLVMAISGHTQMQTFARYINADKNAVRRAAESMDSYHATPIPREQPDL